MEERASSQAQRFRSIAEARPDERALLDALVGRGYHEVITCYFRTSGRRLIEAGWRAVYGELSEQDRSEEDSGGDQLLPLLEQGVVAPM